MDQGPKIRAKMMELLEENTGVYSHDTGFGSESLRYDTKSKSNN